MDVEAVPTPIHCLCGAGPRIDIAHGSNNVQYTRACKRDAVGVWPTITKLTFHIHAIRRTPPCASHPPQHSHHTFPFILVVVLHNPRIA